MSNYNKLGKKNRGYFEQYSDEDLIKEFTAQNIKDFPKEKLTDLFQEVYNRKCQEYGVKTCEVKLAGKFHTKFWEYEDYTMHNKIFFNYENLKKYSNPTNELIQSLHVMNDKNIGMHCYNALDMMAYNTRLDNMKKNFDSGKDMTEEEMLTYAIRYADRKINNLLDKYSGLSAPKTLMDSVKRDSDLASRYQTEIMHQVKTVETFKKYNNVDDYNSAKVVRGVMGLFDYYDDEKKKWQTVDNDNFAQNGEMSKEEFAKHLKEKERFAVAVKNVFKDMVEDEKDKKVLQVLEAGLKVDKNGNSIYRNFIISDMKLAKKYACTIKKNELEQAKVGTTTTEDIPMNI